MCNRSLIFWIGEGEQQAQGNGLRLLGGDPPNQFFQCIRFRFLQDRSLCGSTFRNSEAQVSRSERRVFFKEEIVQPGPVLPPNFDGILKSAGRDERYSRPFALQQGVRPNRSAVKNGDVLPLARNRVDG